MPDNKVSYTTEGKPRICGACKEALKQVDEWWMCVNRACSFSWSEEEIKKLQQTGSISHGG